MMYLSTMDLIYEIHSDEVHCATQPLSSEHETLHVACSYILKKECITWHHTKKEHRLHFEWPVSWEIWISWFFKCTSLVAEQPTFSIVRHFNKELRSNYWLNRCCVLISGYGCHVNQKNSKELIHFTFQTYIFRLIEGQTNKLLGCTAFTVRQRRLAFEAFYLEQNKSDEKKYKIRTMCVCLFING